MDQCAYTQKNDKSRHAGLRKNPVKHREMASCGQFDLFKNADLRRKIDSLTLQDDSNLIAHVQGSQEFTEQLGLEFGHPPVQLVDLILVVDAAKAQCLDHNSKNVFEGAPHCPEIREPAFPSGCLFGRHANLLFNNVRIPLWMEQQHGPASLVKGQTLAANHALTDQHIRVCLLLIEADLNQKL